MTADGPWQRLLDAVEGLPADATLVTPLSGTPFTVTGVQEDRIRVEHRDEDGTEALQRAEFETLHERVVGAADGFDLDRLPPNAEPHAALLGRLPGFEVDEGEWVLVETESASSPRGESGSDTETGDPRGERVDPSIEEMLENMGEPPEEVACPIEGCQYSHRSASSVASHVSASSTDRHVWANTSYAGWRDFVREHGESPDDSGPRK